MAAGVTGNLYGTVSVPNNVAGTPNAAIILVCACQDTSGNAILQVGEFRVPSGMAVNGSFTTESPQTIAVPGTAMQRFDVTFPTAGNLAVTPQANDELFIEINLSSSSTITKNLDIVDAILRIDLA